MCLLLGQLWVWRETTHQASIDRHQNQICLLLVPSSSCPGLQWSAMCSGRTWSSGDGMRTHCPMMLPLCCSLKPRPLECWPSSCAKVQHCLSQWKCCPRCSCPLASPMWTVPPRPWTIVPAMRQTSPKPAWLMANLKFTFAPCPWRRGQKCWLLAMLHRGSNSFRPLTLRLLSSLKSCQASTPRGSACKGPTETETESMSRRRRRRRRTNHPVVSECQGCGNGCRGRRGR